MKTIIEDIESLVDIYQQEDNSNTRNKVISRIAEARQIKEMVTSRLNDLASYTNRLDMGLYKKGYLDALDNVGKYIVGK